VTLRLASGVLVSALIRRVQGEGGNAAVLARGDVTSGSILLVCSDRGRVTSLRERLLTADGHYGWQDVTPRDSTAPMDLTGYFQRRCQRDPDLWILELDIPNAERFAAETIADD
jgi:hypothetical protein